MNLYIQIENGYPINHPALEDNLVSVFGKVPDDWEPFIRVTNPCLENNALVLLQETPEYQKISGVWTDVWFTRQKTETELLAEKQEKINAIKRVFVSRPYASNFAAWVFNEETEKYEPPIPRPTDGKFYRWSGPDNNWKEAEPFPQDGKQYYFDFDNWVNVEIV
jgi:hypothetical protein